VRNLPNREIHEYLCRLLLGEGYRWVHRFMDRPSRVLGKGHRKFFHDNHTPFLLWAFSGDFKAFEASTLHILLDRGLISPSLIKIIHALGDKK
jgi:hypothetical protein